MAHLDTIYKICTILGLVGAGTWSALRWLAKKSVTVIDGQFDKKTAQSVDKRLAEIEASAKSIQCEVKPNGGNSLKDLQVKQMDRFAAQDKMLETILDKVSSVEERVNNIEAKQSRVKEDLDKANHRTEQ